MDVFYYELMFWLLIIAVVVVLTLAACGLVRLVWAVTDVLYERSVRRRAEREARKKRKAEYRRRENEYRRECRRCYRTE